jgi:hypothetical protein
MTAKLSGKSRERHLRSGFWAARRALMRYGTNILSKSSRVGRALAALRDSLVEDLGGDGAISKQQEIVIGLALRTHLLLESLDAFIFTMSSPVNKRKRSVYPIVRERQHLADSLAKYMGQLGLAKRPKPLPSLAEYLAREDNETEKEPAGEDHSANDDGQAAVREDV